MCQYLRHSTYCGELSPFNELKEVCFRKHWAMMDHLDMEEVKLSALFMLCQNDYSSNHLLKRNTICAAT